MHLSSSKLGPDLIKILDSKLVRCEPPERNPAHNAGDAATAPGPYLILYCFAKFFQYSIPSLGDENEGSSESIDTTQGTDVMFRLRGSMSNENDNARPFYATKAEAVRRFPTWQTCASRSKSATSDSLHNTALRNSCTEYRNSTRIVSS